MFIDQSSLFFESREIIFPSRQCVFRVANSSLLETYWQIGKLIVEDEQEGKERADYVKSILKNLANYLTLEFGKGF